MLTRFCYRFINVDERLRCSESRDRYARDHRDGVAVHDVCSVLKDLAVRTANVLVDGGWLRGTRRLVGDSDGDTNYGRAGLHVGQSNTADKAAPIRSVQRHDKLRRR